MAKNFKKGLSAFLAALMCTSTMSLAVNAEDTSNFTAMKLENIVSSGDEYNYMIAQDLISDPKTYYYATSNHTVKIANKGAVHIFPIIDTTRDVVNGTWEADSIYVSGESNYDVVYCCNFATGTREDEEDVTRTYYKRMNLEDSEYFSAELAERLRAIVSVSYPANSVEGAQATLEAAGFEQAYELDRSELISATQGAIWRLANADSIIDGVTDFRYRTTVQTSRKAGWGGYMHNYTMSGEPMNFTDGKKDTAIAEIGSRINALQDFFLTSNDEEFLAKGKAEDGQIVISNLEIVNSLPITGDSEEYLVYLDMKLNYPVDNDEYKLTVTVGENDPKVIPLEKGTVSYSMTVEAEIGETINAVVSGEQTLKKGVYFYAPEPQDIDGDGIATSREVSQNLIGVSAGETTIHAEAEVVLEREPVTGAVTLKKVNGNGDALDGAKFELYTTINGAEILVGEYEVPNGELFIGNLTPGEYKLIETKAPYGYTGAGEISFEIDENGTLTSEALVDGVLVVENTPPSVSFNKGDASNISFMLIDKETGEVEFLYKEDIGGQTTYEIPAEEGKISVVFVKQSTSGMFWASQEIDEDLQEKVIDCLKDNNPSYKGHWDKFFFGAGEFTWVPKKQSVTYTFSGDVAEIDVEISDETLEEPVEEETVVEEPVVEEETNNKNNGKGNNKNKNKNKNK